MTNETQAYLDAIGAVRGEIAGLNRALARTGGEAMRPSVLFRPTFFRNGSDWVAQYGDFPCTVVGSGNTPDEAMRAFDKAWIHRDGGHR